MRPVILALLAALPLPFTAAQAASPEKLEFTVVRNGSEIGTHTVSVVSSGPETRVDVATNIAVKVAFVTVYRFVHEAKELWNGDRLVALNSITNDDGTKPKLVVQANGGNLSVNGDGKQATADAAIMAEGRRRGALGSIHRYAPPAPDAGPGGTGAGRSRPGACGAGRAAGRLGRLLCACPPCGGRARSYPRHAPHLRPCYRHTVGGGVPRCLTACPALPRPIPGDRRWPTIIPA